MIETNPLVSQGMMNENREAKASESLNCPRDLRASEFTDRRILVVEDNEDHQLLTTLVLRKVGSKVAVAEDGYRALELAQAARDRDEPFDVILVDMSMPVLDGYETVRRLRQLGFSTPIIAVTARALESELERCLEAGCDGFLRKPFEAEELHASIAGHIRKVNTTTADSAAEPI